jgi:hypothetical protein
MRPSITPIEAVCLAATDEDFDSALWCYLWLGFWQTLAWELEMESRWGKCWRVRPRRVRRTA